MELAGISNSPDLGASSVILSSLDNSNTTTKNKTLSSGLSDDAANVNLGGVYKSLTVLADEIVSKLDELLAEDLPDGIRSLKQEDYTPEKSAQRIVDGVTGLLGVYSQQNPDLEGEELISSFMKEVRSGVEQGYKQAANILGDLGAFSFDGVQSGIEETLRLVEEKLSAFEADYREKNGIANGEDVQTAANATVEQSSNTAIENRITVSATA